MPAEKEDRIKKLVHFSNPYPARSRRTFLIFDLLTNFDNLDKQEIFIAGRLLSKREHGKLIFADLQDESAKIQLVFKDKKLKDIDIADILQVNGICFVTQKGEKSLFVSDYCLLAKSLEPLPEKWHGIKDE